MLQITENADLGREDAVSDTGIAIVGMSCRFAGARGLDPFWDLLREGREGVETFDDAALLAAGVAPAMLRKPNYVRRGAPIEDMECFDAGLFGLSPRDAAIMDPQHRHFLECSWEALENAGHVPHRFGGAIGVFAGSGHNAYMPYHLLTNPKLVRDVGLFLLRHTSNDKDFLTTRASYLLDLTGPSINVQTACSTSLVAMHMAAQSLLSGECDMAIAGGTSIELPHRQGYLFEPGEILSPDGHCRPFDAASQGTVFGSGVAVVVLRRLSDAVEAGDHIYAVLRGSAINNDGAGKVGYLAPSVDGQARVIAEALAVADIDADTIDYVEAHGTGTPVGDPIEIAALTQAFRETSARVGDCAIGSVKANIGHTDTAAGAAGVIKVALSLHHRMLPPTLNFTEANGDCGFATSPFAVQAKLAEWRSGATPRRAGISSLGVGGTNAHAVLEEAPPRAPSGPSRDLQLLLVSARSGSALAANAAAQASYFEAHPNASLADAAYTLSIGRQHLSQRRFVVADSKAAAAQSLRCEAERTDAAPPCIVDRPTSFLFCGAGAQHAGMARRLYAAEGTFRASVDEALAILDRSGAPEVRRWLLPSDADAGMAAKAMERPSVALPALFTIQVALARLWMSLGVNPAGMIGHSSGEYAAAHIAGVIDLDAGLKIVRARGELFETVQRGGMLSVPLPEAELAPLLRPELSIAAINAPRLCVVSGSTEAIEQLETELKAREVEAQRVRISVAAHSPMLDPILPQFRALMETIELRAPRLPFVSNLTGDWITPAQAISADYWVRHLRQTVRFTDGLQRLLEAADHALLEVGPGRAMSSLVRQHPLWRREQPVQSSLPHPDQPVADDRFFWTSVGQLWVTGVSIDWDAYWNGERRQRIPLPTYQFDRQRHWIEAGTSIAPAVDETEPLERHEAVGDWLYQQVWERADRPVLGMPDGPALIFADETGLGEAIGQGLLAAGREVIWVRPGNRFRQDGDDRFRLEPDNASHYTQLFDTLNAAGRLPAQIYHCWGVTGGGHGSAERLLRHGLFSLAAMAPLLARDGGEQRVPIAVLTDRAQRVAGEEMLDPAKACTIAACRVITTEYPNLDLRAIDVAPRGGSGQRAMDQAARMVIAELASEADEGPVALRGEARWRCCRRPLTSAGDPLAATTAIRQGAAYLVTGGLGGVGLTIARHLADRGARIALVTRRALPPRTAWPDLIATRDDPREADRLRKLLALEALGATVEIVVADVADARAMRRAVRHATKRLGPIAGVFHAAGVLDDGLIEGRTRAAMEAVLRPKIAGTLALEAALAGQSPDFILLFSSISAMAGLPGQIDYAAANAFLDAYAEARRSDPDTRVIAVGWSQWSEVGMAASLNAAAHGQPIDALDGGEAMAHPFLERLHRVSPDLYVAAATLTPDRHWLLGEHRLDGVGPLIPGTGYLELARAAHAAIESGPCMLSDIVFAAPFVVADGETRTLHVQLQRRTGSEWRFTIMGKGPADAGWTEHASGLVRPCSEQAEPSAIDLVQIAAAYGHASDDRVHASHVLAFGPRWANVTAAALGQDQAMLWLELPPAYRADLEQIALHPALLDLATAGAQALIPGYDAARDFFAPFSYRRLTLHAPLPARVVSHVRYRDAGGSATAVFDITICNEQGVVLATVAEFTMLRVDERALERMNAGERPGVVATSAQPLGILPEQGIEVIERILALPARSHVLVSPCNLDAAITQLRAPRHTGRDRQNDQPLADGEQPGTPMELAIAELWEDLLGVSPVRRSDDFFDLGGHSLLAVQFVNRFRKKTGRTLALAALLDSPTVERLARVIDPDGARADVAVTIEPPREVVTIRAGGDAMPLFFVHDGLGETLLYRGLALQLDPARAVYGIEPRRVGNGFAHTRIDEMAEDYVRRLRVVQPNGPYLLAGLCAGGVIAFEMARQLEAQGEQVGFVGIIDAADVAAAKRSFYLTRVRLGRLQGLVRQGAGPALLGDLVTRGFNMLRWEASSRVRRLLDRRQVQRIEQGEAAPEMAFLPLYEVAHRAHRPTGLLQGGEVTLFKASNGTGAIEDIPYGEIYADAAMGWARRVAGQVTVVPVPGGHGSALQEPNVATLAREMQHAIDRATRGVEGAGDPPRVDDEREPMMEAAE